YKLNIHDNNFFDNKQLQVHFSHDVSTMARITNVTMKNNVFVAKTAKQMVGYFYTISDNNDMNAFGKIDSNYYARPVDDNVTMRTVTGLYTSSQSITTRTLAGWQQAYVHDDHSKKSPKTLSSSVNPDDYLKLVYNASKANKTIALSGTYIDMRNKTYSGSIT